MQSDVGSLLDPSPRALRHIGMTSSGSEASSPYPLSDAPFVLPSGTTVRLRNRIGFRGHHSQRLTIVIETPTPATAVAQLRKESRQLAEMLRQFADAARIDRLTVMICRTQACVEMREPSNEMFHFLAKEIRRGRQTQGRHHNGCSLTIVEPDERAMEAAAPPPHFMNSLAG
jgi:hypothetical protein